MADEENLVEREIRIAATPETVFTFFTDPQKMVRWMGSMALLETRPGGLYKVVIGDRIARGRFLEVVPYTRIVFTWGWEGEGPVPPDSTTVEITLEREGRETVLRLAHRLLTAEARETHDRGWEHYLARLAVAAGGGDPGPDPMAITMPAS